MAVSGAFGPDVPVFATFQKSAEGRRWLAALPRLVRELEEAWGIETGVPFRGGMASWVAPAVCADGAMAVLKVNPPEPECREEMTALDLWAGDGAVRLYRSDRARGALLVEQCLPGVSLYHSGLEAEEALVVAAGVLRRLWQVAVPEHSGFDRLGDVTCRWAGLVRDRMAQHRPPFDPGLVEVGARLLEDLPSGGPNVLVHGDFNPGNILSAQREPWLAIDAKPLVGDAAYDASPLVEQVGDPFDAHDPASMLGARYRHFAELVGVPVDKLLAWAVARHVESALWDVSRGDLADGQDTMRGARILADLAGL